MITSLIKEESLQQTKIIYVNRGDALDSKKKKKKIYISIDRQLKILVNTYDNSNKISFLDNIAKILTFYLLLKTHDVTFFLMYLFVYVLLFRLQKV